MRKKPVLILFLFDETLLNSLSLQLDNHRKWQKLYSLFFTYHIYLSLYLSTYHIIHLLYIPLYISSLLLSLKMRAVQSSRSSRFHIETFSSIVLILSTYFASFTCHVIKGGLFKRDCFFTNNFHVFTSR